MTDDILNGREMPAEEQEKLEEKIIDLDPDKLKFYEDLRRKAKDWTKQKGGSTGNKLAEYLFLLPDFFIMVARLAVDKRISVKQKAKVAGIIAYLIMPLDIIPDFIPVIGHVDDLVLLVMGLNIILNDTDPKVLEDNWSGEGNVLEHMQKITATAERFLDKRIFDKIRKFFKR